MSSLALPVVSRRWRKGCLRAPAAAVPGSAPVPAETAQSHGATGRVAPLFNLCAATRCRIPRPRGETLRRAALGNAMPKPDAQRIDAAQPSGAIQESPWRSAHRVSTPWVPVLELAACKTLATPSPGSTRGPVASLRELRTAWAATARNRPPKPSPHPFCSLRCCSRKASHVLV